jgi:type I restriction enzyme S subunit
MNIWKSKKLKELDGIEIILGQSPSSKSYNKKKNGLPFLQGKAEFGMIYPKPEIYTEAPLKIAEGNDLLLSVRAPVGDINLSPFKLCIGRGLAAIRFKKDNPKFYFYWFLKNQKHIESLGVGSTFKAITGEQLKKITVPIVELAEQTAIANILSTVDEAIQKADEAITKTERIKQAMMQKLLSEGIGHKELKQTKIGKIPKTWTIKKFSEFVESAMGGGTPSTKIESHWTGGIHWMTSANIDGKEVFKGQKMINADAVRNSATNLIPKDSLLVATRVGIGKACINRVDMAISQDLTGFVLNNQIKLEFLYWFLMANQTKLKSLAQGSTIKGILKSDILKMDIPFPDLEEQIIISNLLDNLLNLLELKLNRKKQLEKIKQGLMDDLLTGKKRIKIN